MIVSVKSEFSADENLGDIAADTAAPTAIGDALLLFKADSSTEVNYGCRENAVVTLDAAGAGASSVVVQLWAWNTTIGKWAKVEALNGGAAITGTNGFVAEFALAANALVGKTAVYLQVSGLANITTLFAWLRARVR